MRRNATAKGISGIARDAHRLLNSDIDNPVTDGAVAPILQLNNCKIANPTILARISPSERQGSSIGRAGMRLRRLERGLDFHRW
jgi:XFP N-terminal domain